MDKEYVRSHILLQPKAISPVALFDDMEATLDKWKETGGDGAPQVGRDATIAFDGEASLQVCGRAAGVDDDIAWVRRYFGNPNVGDNFKLNLAFMVQNLIADFWTMEIWLDFHLAAGLLSYRFRFNGDTIQWEIYTEAATWIDTGIVAVNYDNVLEHWHSLSMTGNIALPRWTSVRINDQEYDATDYQPDIGITGNYWSSLQIYMHKRAVSANAVNLHVDNIEVSFSG